MQNTIRSSDAPLRKLKDSELTVKDFHEDIRGRKVIDRDGTTIGHVSGLFIDDTAQKVRMLEIGGGGFLGIGDRHFLLPVDSITKIDTNDIHVDETGGRVHDSPAYDPALVGVYDRSYWGPYYGYYGRPSYWSDGYEYPVFDNWYRR